MKRSFASCVFVFVMSSFAQVPGFASDSSPDSSNKGSNFSADSAGTTDTSCLDHGKQIPIDDAQVLKLETSTQNQFRTRAHIEGKIYAIYSDHAGHSHFGVQIGKTTAEAIEVIYNQSFGALPNLAVGDDLEACGDYITSTAPSGPYPASPDHAILHWVHRSNSSSHDSGFVIVNGTLFGSGNGRGN